MSITLKHAGLPYGIGRFTLINTFDSVTRSVFGIAATAIQLLRHHISKCRDSDFLARRICGTWEQPQQAAMALGISTRVFNNAERELIAKSFINRTATPHARRESRQSGGNITYTAGIESHQDCQRPFILSYAAIGTLSIIIQYLCSASVGGSCRWIPAVAYC